MLKTTKTINGTSKSEDNQIDKGQLDSCHFFSGR